MKKKHIVNIFRQKLIWREVCSTNSLPSTVLYQKSIIKYSKALIWVVTQRFVAMSSLNVNRKLFTPSSRNIVPRQTTFALNCLKDIYLKTSSKSNVGRTDGYIFKFFLERTSFSDFCCATNQNNLHVLKYVSYDRSRLLQPCGKCFSWAPPIPRRNFYPLAPSPLRNFHSPSVGGGGYGYFLESHIKGKSSKEVTSQLSIFSCWICQEELSSQELLLEHYDNFMRPG